MSEPTRLPPSVGRAIPTDFGLTREQVLRQLGVDEPNTGGVDPLADHLLEEADYSEAVNSMGLPDDPKTRDIYQRVRRNFLYAFERKLPNEISVSKGDRTSDVRAFERRMTPRLSPEENRAIVKFNPRRNRS
jgi:hypothetical protein